MTFSSSKHQKKAREKRFTSFFNTTRCSDDLNRSLLQACNMSPMFTTRVPSRGMISTHFPSSFDLTCSPPTSSWLINTVFMINVDSSVILLPYSFITRLEIRKGKENVNVEQSSMRCQD
nr:hypothetical protein Iba_chr04cCG14140 [Ipomoea batatas]